jgi:hypothetical protein
LETRKTIQYTVALLVDDLAGFGEAEFGGVLAGGEAVGAHELMLFCNAVDLFSDDARNLELSGFWVGHRRDVKTVVFGREGRCRGVRGLVGCAAEKLFPERHEDPRREFTVQRRFDPARPCQPVRY